MDQYRNFIALSRYAKWRDEDNRRETWNETVDRYFNFFIEEGKLTEEEAEPLKNAMCSHDVMGSMRAVMTAGEALRRDNVAGFNCSYSIMDGCGEPLTLTNDKLDEPVVVNIKDPVCFDEVMYILMCGTGLGFSAERQYTNQLPKVGKKLNRRRYQPTGKNYPKVNKEEISILDRKSNTVIVEDSKYGWASAFRVVMFELFNGNFDINWDVSKVRPAGEKLKTFGGRASGPQPLIDLFEFTKAKMKAANGRKLSSLEVHDIVCKVADIVVVGGVRRSALISLSNPSDDRIRKSKTGQWWEDNPQRALANNSACYTEKPDFESFLSEWQSLYESKSGERGMFSRVASQRKAAENGRRDATREFGTNPCCFTGDQKLLVADGFGQHVYVNFKELAKRSTVKVVNNEGNVTKGSVWSSGIRDTVFVNFSNRDAIHCTPDHVFMLNNGEECQAKDLKGRRPMPFIDVFKPDVSSPYFLGGYMLGDAALGRLGSDKHLGLEVYFSKKDQQLAQEMGADLKGNCWYSRYAKEVALGLLLPPTTIGARGFPASLHSVEGLAGLYSANGCVIKAGRVALKSIDKGQVEAVQSILLEKFGISSYITVNKTKTQTFSNGDYVCKESYDLNISQYTSILTFSQEIGFGQEYKRAQLKELLIRMAPTVSKVVKGNPEEVFDFTEPDNHWGVVEGCVVHNSEIILRPYQFCNLSEVVVRADDTLLTLTQKVEKATILGTLQATLTDFCYLRPVWKQNTEEEALLGVSLTGIMDNRVMAGVATEDEIAEFVGDDDSMSTVDDLKTVLSVLKQAAIRVNKQWAEKLGINQSAAITCVKPSGTVSQLVDSASGIHPRYSPFYIRTVRADIKDPLAKFMTKAGFPVEPCAMKPTTTQVFSFPQRAPEGSICVSDVGAMEQLKLWKVYQDFWCEHKPSITVYYKDSEFLEIGQWLYNNFDDVSGVSFLPYSEHTYQQAPYQDCDEGVYNQWLSKMPQNVDWSKLGEFEKEDGTKGSKELACSAGVCELVDL